MKKILVFAITLFFSCGISAQQSPGKSHSKLNISCNTCHVCNVPTKDDPCLISCPRENIATVYQKPEQTPELIIIDQISDRYNPVYFSHRIHAQMSTMSGGCENCHHFNTSGPILQCNSCHESSRKRENISLPDLKGAYHRQCMDCHREWSHETGCNSCHTLKNNSKVTKQENTQKKYSGKVHPIVLEPTHITYQTNSDKGKLVTFYHDDHTKKFGLNCTSCHKQEACTKCHDVNRNSDSKLKPVVANKTFKEQHKNCISCHKENDCGTCHSNTGGQPFDHAKKTGWALSKHHVNLACAKCHGSKLPYKKVDNKCLSCHQNWNNETFNHTVTGMQLNETHLDLSCDDCHLENNYAKKTSCDGCHEDFVYPKNKPGKLIGK